MKHGRDCAVGAAWFALLVSVRVFSQDGATADVEVAATPQTLVRLAKSHVDFDAQADGSYSYTVEQILIPLTEQAVRAIGNNRSLFAKM